MHSSRPVHARIFSLLLVISLTLSVPTSAIDCGKRTRVLGVLLAAAAVFGTGAWMRHPQPSGHAELGELWVPDDELLSGHSLLSKREGERLATMSLEEFTKAVRAKYGLRVINVDGAEVTGPAKKKLSDSEFRTWREMADKVIASFNADGRRGKLAGKYLERGATVGGTEVTESALMLFGEPTKLVSFHEFLHHVQSGRDNKAYGKGSYGNDLLGSLEAAEQKLKQNPGSARDLLHERRMAMALTLYLTDKELQAVSHQLVYRDELNLNRKEITESLRYMFLQGETLDEVLRNNLQNPELSKALESENLMPETAEEAERLMRLFVKMDERVKQVREKLNAPEFRTLGLL